MTSQLGCLVCKCNKREEPTKLRALWGLTAPRTLHSAANSLRFLRNTNEPKQTAEGSTVRRCEDDIVMAHDCVMFFVGNERDIIFLRF